MPAISGHMEPNGVLGRKLEMYYLSLTVTPHLIHQTTKTPKTRTNPRKGKQPPRTPKWLVEKNQQKSEKFIDFYFENVEKQGALDGKATNFKGKSEENQKAED